MAEIRDLEDGVQATKAMPRVVMRFLGQRSDRLRCTSSGAREMLHRGVKGNHGAVRDSAEPMGIGGPAPGGVGRDRNPVQGGAGPFCRDGWDETWATGQRRWRAASH